MKTTIRILVPLIVLGVGIGGLIAMGMRSDPPPGPPPATMVPKVKAVLVQAHRGSFNIDVDGTVSPFREIVLSAEVAGRVSLKTADCNEGNFVRRGAHLFTIDPQDYRLEVRRLSEHLRQAESDLRELEVDRASTLELIKLAEEQLQLEQKELARLVNLAGGRVITDSEVDRERRTELTLRNQLLTLRKDHQLLNTRYARLQSGRALAEIQLEKANLDLQRTKVVAPVDGVIVRDMVEQDSYIQKGSQLVTIDDTSAVEVICNLRMDDLYWLWSQNSGRSVVDASADESLDRRQPPASAEEGFQIPRTPVTVVYRFSGLQSQAYLWQGILDRYDGTGLDEATRTIPCRVLVTHPRDVRVLSQGEPIPNPYETNATERTSLRGDSNGAARKPLVSPPALLRGMFVTVVVHAPPSNWPLLKVPEQTVQADKTLRVARLDPRDNQYRCHIIRGIKLVEVMTEFGETDTESAPGQQKFWLIDPAQSGLREGDLAITTPLAVVAEGNRVKLDATSSGGEE